MSPFAHPDTHPDHDFLELWCQYRDGGRRGNEAAEIILKRYHGWLFKLVLKLGAEPSDRDDLLVAAQCGLVIALAKWDPERQVKFITFATHWIMNELWRELARLRRIILPPKLTTNASRIRRMTEEWMRTHTEPPVEEEICSLTGLTSADVRYALQSVPSCVTLADVVRPDETPDAWLERYQPALPPRQVEDEVVHEHTLNEICLVLCELDARLVTVLALRYGLSGAAPVSFKEIAKHLRASESTVRHWHDRAIERLKRLLAEPKG
ncbi:MAG: RNA polymerase primary sigma factor [Candidatus Berkelbacteria bacterium Gr01-1014_85]|uniref:RNA polymerase primary sigma factor n=1 Tax=Candidatus Berkelbacteria bacterium Gr01-1014_85 TaxID=2017150 RepID=A0A554JA06_9BACT|nr:MAG: RNA polymerase primary sigma factor [Candidatus Berkelbacteria bacterium Gr01-1014_85]